MRAIKQVDVVISTIGSANLADQEKLIAAIKEAGNVKVAQFFIPCVLFQLVLYVL